MSFFPICTFTRRAVLKFLACEGAAAAIAVMSFGFHIYSCVKVCGCLPFKALIKLVGIKT
ncbi:twin-arginine translocation signal domain-containing protein [Raoultella ornithinolytica]|nr:twin-arginine translocation signal domain-containing protein [Raoultella ornithinolytica]